MAIIPARGGSKGLPRKNVKQLLGKPLIAWTIQQSLDTPEIGRTVVTTDAHRIAKVSDAFGAEAPFRRPEKISGDNATIEVALLHCMAWYEKFEDYSPDAIVMLQCTCPVRRRGAISEAIKQFEASGADCVVSVSPFRNLLWEEGKSKNKSKGQGAPKPLYNYQKRRRQDANATDIRYKENGSIYIIKSDILKKKKNRVAGEVSLYKMTEMEGHQIDTQLDFELMEIIMQNFHERR